MRVRKISVTGFTLVEIMIVVAIIGLLAAIAIPNFVRARTTSQQNACIENLRQIDAAKQQWALEARQGGDPTPTSDQILVYMNHGVSVELPTCPATSDTNFATSYLINPLSITPVCLISSNTHTLDAASAGGSDVNGHNGHGH